MAQPRPIDAALWTALIAALLIGYCATHLRIKDDIAHFLPDGAGAPDGRVLKQLSKARISQRMVLVLSGADTPLLLRASHRLATGLRKHSEFTRVENGVDERAQRQVFDIYFPRRHSFYSDRPEVDYPAALSDSGLRSTASQLLSLLGSIDGSLTARLAPQDPLLSFPRIAERLQSANQGGLTLREDTFLTADGTHAVLFLETRAAMLDATAQRRVLSHIATEFAEVKAVVSQNLELAQSGINRYAVRAQESIRADIERISMLSSIAMLALFIVVFRSPWALLLVALPTLLGMLAALAGTLAAFGSVHGATLAFGATLIGVCVDYPVHLLGHHALGAGGRPVRATLQEVWPPIVLGGLSTIAGLMGLAWASFPGIREMAIFTSTGVVVALLVTRYAVPHWLPAGGKSTFVQRATAAELGRLLGYLSRRRAGCTSLLLAGLALCAFGLPRLRFADDLGSWIPAPTELRAEDKRVQKLVGAKETGRLIITTGATLESALAANDRVASLLAKATSAHEMGGFRSLHALLFSEALQIRNLEALRATPALRERFTQAFDQAGFAPDAFEPFFASIARPVKPLGLPELRKSALAPMVSAFLLNSDSQPALITYLNDLRDPYALKRRLAQEPAARYFDQNEFLRDTYARFRSRTLELVGAGLGLVFLIVLARYRAFRPTCAAVVPALLAAGGALSLLGMLGVTLDLFHVVGLVLVLSMGVDYGIFLVESRTSDQLGATALGVVLGCITTILSFGLLATSSIPALRSLGQVVSVGLVLALLWAPASLFVLGGRGAS